MQEKSRRRSNQDRTHETQTALIAAARKLFVEKGFSETSTPEIVKAAKITRGALYHHFKDKTDLFRAVVEQEALAVAEHIKLDSADITTPREALTAGAEAYFKAMSKDGRAKLLLVEGPAVLGLEKMEQIDKKAGGQELKTGLEEALSRKAKSSISIEVLTEMLSAAFDKGALAISEGKNAEEYKKVISFLFEAILKE